MMVDRSVATVLQMMACCISCRWTGDLIGAYINRYGFVKNWFDPVAD